MVQHRNDCQHGNASYFFSSNYIVYKKIMDSSKRFFVMSKINFVCLRSWREKKKFPKIKYSSIARLFNKLLILRLKKV